MNIEERRAAVVAEALSWQGTPYVTGGRIKGPNGGADCLTFIAGVLENVGEIERLPIPTYPHDWHLHQTDELYMLGKGDTPGVTHFCQEIEGPPLPGDLVFWKFGHCFAHSAIVINWPSIIHAWVRRPVSLDDAERRTTLKTIHEVAALRNTPRPRKFFRLKAWL